MFWDKKRKFSMNLKMFNHFVVVKREYTLYFPCIFIQGYSSWITSWFVDWVFTKKLKNKFICTSRSNS